MKCTSKLIVAALVACAAFSADAQVYPYSAPSYVPIAILQPVTVSVPTDVVFTNNGSATIGISALGTCTSFAAVGQVSNDGTNYSAVTLYPLNSIAAASGVASTSASGMWHSNIQSWRYFRLHVTALTASCTIGLAADDITLQLY